MTYFIYLGNKGYLISSAIQQNLIRFVENQIVLKGKKNGQLKNVMNEALVKGLFNRNYLMIGI